MIYTSGSTGRPKGVKVPHRALRNLIAWVTRDYGIVPGFKVATHPSFSFDASVIDIFPTLAAGGELHVLAEEIRKDLPSLRDYLVEKRIGGLTVSTQLGMAIVNSYPEIGLKWLQLGGEKLLPVAKTDVQLINGYGPTEFCVSSSYEKVDQAREGDIPIGRPVANTYSLIVDRYGQLLPRGAVGELALMGPQLSDGYWRQPEKTQKAFTELKLTQSDLRSWEWQGGALRLGLPSSTTIPEKDGVGVKVADGAEPNSCELPRESDSALKIYRTGDLARYNDEGKLEYFGRIDFQVKLRGFRIEIGEIESVAKSFPGIGAVAAEVRKVGGAEHLVLYYEVKSKGEKGKSAEEKVKSKSEKGKSAGLKDFLKTRLTAYMVPDYFVEVGTMPLTPVGKIDRKALPTPSAADAGAPRAAEPPANELERTIIECYREVLETERFGATDDFFDCGGTSIVAIQAVVRLQKAGLDVQYGDLFKYQTPRALAAFLGGDSAAAPAAESAFAGYDYSAIDAMLAKTNRELYRGFEPQPLGHVLLTGATGYLGMHVLRYLLEATDSHVSVLVRPKKNVGAERRVDSQYVYYFGSRLPERLRGRITFLEGDVTDERLDAKLPAGRRRQQADDNKCVDGGKIDTVINCAALVKHYVTDDRMERINVGGVKNLLAFCEKRGAKLIQTSTYSIGGMIPADSVRALDEFSLYLGQDSDNEYLRTKFLAERLTLEAIAAGRVRGKIMRLGNLMGREADGEFQMNLGANAFVNSLKSYHALGVYPLVELTRSLEMSPIDRVAEAVCLLATTPDDQYVFHPYNRYALDMGAVVAAMNARGLAVEAVSADAFAARVEEFKGDPARAEELQGILHYAGHLVVGRRMTPAVNDWTTTVLYRLGFRWLPTADGYLANFLDMLESIGVFESKV